MKIAFLGMIEGAAAPAPPLQCYAAAPKGAPRRPQLPYFLETILAPPCPARGPEAGSTHINYKYITDFHLPGL